jgi:hypothetical protein
MQPRVARWFLVFSAVLLSGPVGLVTAQPCKAQSVSPEAVRFVYELNRARHAPASWAEEMGLASRIGGDGQSATLLDVLAKPPLAISEILAEAAFFHSNDMGKNNFLAHASDTTGLLPNQRVREAGYLLPYQIALEGILYDLPNAENSVESLAAGYGAEEFDFEDPVNVLLALIVDTGVESLGHRNHVLGVGTFLGASREVGVGYASYASSDFQNYWTIYTGFTADLDNFLTGVVYRDDNENQRYDAGEGLDGVTVVANAEETVTGSAGNWAIALSDGSYQVECKGASFEGTARMQVELSGYSRAVDCVSGQKGGHVDFVAVPEPSVTLAQLTMLTFLVALARRQKMLRPELSSVRSFPLY